MAYPHDALQCEFIWVRPRICPFRSANPGVERGASYPGVAIRPQMHLERFRRLEWRERAVLAGYVATLTQGWAVAWGAYSIASQEIVR